MKKKIILFSVFFGLLICVPIVYFTIHGSARTSTNETKTIITQTQYLRVSDGNLYPIDERKEYKNTPALRVNIEKDFDSDVKQNVETALRNSDAVENYRFTNQKGDPTDLEGMNAYYDVYLNDYTQYRAVMENLMKIRGVLDCNPAWRNVLTFDEDGIVKEESMPFSFYEEEDIAVNTYPYQIKDNTVTITDPENDMNCYNYTLKNDRILSEEI